MILADESVHGQIVQSLRDNDFEVDWILEDVPGISDFEVIEIAKSNKQILITEDKDFGEWVFSHNINGLTVIFLRYAKDDLSAIIRHLNQSINSLLGSDSMEHYFITINRNKTRKRKI